MVGGDENSTTDNHDDAGASCKHVPKNSTSSSLQLFLEDNFQRRVRERFGVCLCVPSQSEFPSLSLQVLVQEFESDDTVTADCTRRSANRDVTIAADTPFQIRWVCEEVSARELHFNGMPLVQESSNRLWNAVQQQKQGIECGSSIRFLPRVTINFSQLCV